MEYIGVFYVCDQFPKIQRTSDIMMIMLFAYLSIVLYHNS